MISTVTAIETLVGVAVLCATSWAVLRLARVEAPLAPTLAVLRGAVQLAAIGFVLSGVITRIGWVVLALAVMFTVAAVTTTRRVGWSRRHLVTVLLAIASGAGVALVIVFLSGALELSPRYALAIGGIVIGNAMGITSLAARRFLDAVGEQWDQVEGWLALGAMPAEATRPIGRRTVALALVPSIDQTKTTGLVTLPGAFVGAIFGGLSPLEAGRFQIVVLAAIITAGSISATVVVHLLGDVRHRPIAS